MDGSGEAANHREREQFKQFKQIKQFLVPSLLKTTLYHMGLKECSSAAQCTCTPIMGTNNPSEEQLDLVTDRECPP